MSTTPLRKVYDVVTRWAPLSEGAMRHVLHEVDGPINLPDDVVRSIAKGFLSPGPGAAHFAAQRRNLGATKLMLMTLSAMRIKSAGGLDTRGLVHLGFILSGAARIHLHQGPHATLAPGSAVAVNDWRSFDAECINGTRCLSVMVPEQHLIDRGVHLTPARFRIDGPRSLRSPLRDFALAIVDAGWNGSTVGEQVAERTIEELVIGLFLEADGYSMDSEDLRAGLRSRALSEIAARHRRKDLSPALVAEHLSVSLRHLQRAFEHSGLTVAGAITCRRAESAALLLSSPRGSALTIEEIAGGAGFSSVFELRAAFRKRYGMLPSEFRNREHTGTDG